MEKINALIKSYNIWYNYTLFCKKFNSDNNYELNNIIERYLISVHNNIPESYEKMCSELVEKNLYKYIDPKNLIFDKNIPNIKYDLKSLKKDKNFIYFEDFKYKITDRIEYLIEISSLIDTCICCLKYTSLNSGSQQWGVPFNTADFLYNLNFINEGFASPINSRIIEKNIYNFCSLFYNTDKIYGSIGSFFDVNFDNYNGNWSINPPMIEKLTEEMAIKIIDSLDKNENKTIFVSMANWRDSTAYQLLLNSKYMFHYTVLPPGIAYYNDSEKNVIAIKTYSAVYFLLGKKINFIGLRDTWLINPNTLEKINYLEKTFYLFNDRKFTPFGTKYRAMEKFIKLQKEKGYKELIYAGPAYGVGGYALANGCFNYGMNVKLFLSGTSIPEQGLNFPKYIIDNFKLYKKSLSEIYEIVNEYLKQNEYSKEIPFGMNDLDYIDCLKTALLENKRIQEIINFNPKRIWLAVGSGVILSILLQIFPTAEFHCVQVGKTLNFTNERITLYYSPENFTENAHIIPPYPSLLNYDAKIWQHIIKNGKNGDLIWNVY